MISELRMVVSDGGEWQLQYRNNIPCCDASGAIAAFDEDPNWKDVPTVHGNGLLIDGLDRTCEERDEAENAADRLASLVLGERIDWADHGDAWQRAINLLESRQLQLPGSLSTTVSVPLLWESYCRANDMLRSLYQVVDRQGESTGWETLRNRLLAVLTEQHQIMYPKPT